MQVGREEVREASGEQPKASLVHDGFVTGVWVGNWEPVRGRGSDALHQQEEQ